MTSKTNFMVKAGLLIYLVGLFATWTFLVAKTIQIGNAGHVMWAIMLGWVPGSLWPFIGTVLLWLKFWF